MPPQLLSNDELVHFMQLCVALAHDALPVQEVPVSAMYIHLPTRTIMGASFNQTVIKKNAIRHCEVECLYQLEQRIKTVLKAYKNNNYTPSLSIQNHTNTENNTISTMSNDTETTALTSNTLSTAYHSTILTHEQSNEILASYIHNSGLTQNEINMMIDNIDFMNIVDVFNHDDDITQTSQSSSQNTTCSSQPTDSTNSKQLNIPTIHTHHPYQPQANSTTIKTRQFMIQLIRQICSDIACIVSVEPCIMCTGVLTNAGIRYVYAGCGNDKFGGCGSIVSCNNTYSFGLAAPRSPLGIPFVKLPITNNNYHELSFVEKVHASFNDFMTLSDDDDNDNNDDDGDDNVTTNDCNTNNTIDAMDTCKNEPNTTLGDTNDKDNVELNNNNNNNNNQSNQQHLFNNPSHLEFKQQLEYNEGCLRQEAIKALQVFYLRGNPNAPSDKRQRVLMNEDECIEQVNNRTVNYNGSNKKNKSNYNKNDVCDVVNQMVGITNPSHFTIGIDSDIGNTTSTRHSMTDHDDIKKVKSTKIDEN